MKLAIIGSRSCSVENLWEYLPRDVTLITSGGAKGVDTCAKELAQERGIEFLEIVPEYTKYGRATPIKRNDVIIDAADHVLIFWDGVSRGTQYVIRRCQKTGKPHEIILCH